MAKKWYLAARCESCDCTYGMPFAVAHNQGRTMECPEGHTMTVPPIPEGTGWRAPDPLPTPKPAPRIHKGGRRSIYDNEWGKAE